MPWGQINTISSYVSTYFEIDQVPTMKGWWAGFDLRATIWEPLFYIIIVYKCTIVNT